MKNIIKIILYSNERKIQDLLSEENQIYTFLNPVSYLEARKDKQLFEKFDGIFIDGSILVKAFKYIYKIVIKRRSFDMTSIAPELFSFSIKNRKTIYFVGAKEDEIKITINILKKEYPLLNIVGYRNGYFNDQKEVENEYKKIISVKPNFLIIGMGGGYQERFLLKIKEQGFKGIGFTCGGFISQTAKGINNIDYYPQWVDKYNIRFFYRIYKEKHTRRRYLKAAFIFPIIFIKDWIFK